MKAAPGQLARGVARSLLMSRQGGRLNSVCRDFPASTLGGGSQGDRPSYHDLLQEVEDLQAGHQQHAMRRPPTYPVGHDFDPAITTLFGPGGGEDLGQELVNVPEYDPTVINLPWEVQHNLRHGMGHFLLMCSVTASGKRTSEWQ